MVNAFSATFVFITMYISVDNIRLCVSCVQQTKHENLAQCRDLNIIRIYGIDGMPIMKIKNYNHFSS